MQTGQITSNIVVGGIQFSSTVSREADGQIGHSTALAAGIAGVMGDAGVDIDGITAGHGLLAADIIDVHWTDAAGLHKCRKGITIDTANANDVVFDEAPAGTGDAYPAAEWAVIIGVQVVIDTDFDGDLNEMIACKSTVRANADFQEDDNTLLLAVKLVAGEAWSWCSDQSIANPLTGNAVGQIKVSNGSITAGTFYCGVLYQSV